MLLSESCPDCVECLAQPAHCLLSCHLPTHFTLNPAVSHVPLVWQLVSLGILKDGFSILSCEIINEFLAFSLGSKTLIGCTIVFWGMENPLHSPTLFLGYFIPTVLLHAVHTLMQKSAGHTLF